MKPCKLMYAIIGDIAGSVYEFSRNKEIPTIQSLIKEGCTFTDDTVHTIAIAEAILNNTENPDFASSIRKWSKKYPHAGYGGRIRAWFKGEGPGDSFGNGAYMRISPLYWVYFGVQKKAMMAHSIACSHDHPQSYLFIDALLDKREPVWCSTEAQKDLYSGELSVEEYHKHYKFNSSCIGSVPEAIYIARHASSYEECLKQAISLCGDTDTQAAIAGGIYGYLTNEEIPDDLYNWAWNLLPKEMTQIIEKYEKYIQKEWGVD